jgi:hypothetical protein
MLYDRSSTRSKQVGCSSRRQEGQNKEILKELNLEKFRDKGN